MNVNIFFNESKPKPPKPPRRRKRRVATGANIKLLLCTLAQTGFLTAEQATALVIILGVSHV